MDLSTAQEGAVCAGKGASREAGDCFKKTFPSCGFTPPDPNQVTYNEALACARASPLSCDELPDVYFVAHDLSNRAEVSIFDNISCHGGGGDEWSAHNRDGGGVLRVITVRRSGSNASQSALANLNGESTWIRAEAVVMHRGIDFYRAHQLRGVVHLDTGALEDLAG
jgi:hypothetical protein